MNASVQTPNSQRPKDVLIHLAACLPITLDPAVGYDTPSATAIQNIYETLVTYAGSEVRHVAPLLAESWSVSSDNQRLTFRLRSGVRFHNGRPLDADCVVYSLRRAIQMNQGPAWILSQGLSEESLWAADNLSVEMLLPRPFPNFLHCLTQPVASIVEPSVVEAHGGIVPDQENPWMAQHAVGTGPFVLGEWRPQSELVLLRNDQYWQVPTQLARVNVKHIWDANLRRRALLHGEADLADISSAEAYQLIGQPGIAVVSGQGVDREMIGFNTRQAPFSDVRVRQAIAYAIDYEALLNMEPGYDLFRTDGPIPTQIDGHDDGLFFYQRDLVKAKALLHDAGYAPGFSTTLACNEFPQRRRIAEIVADSLRAIRIDVQVEALPWDNFVDKLKQGALPVFAWNWVPDYPAPDCYVAPIYHSRSPENCAGYANPIVDSLIEAAQVENDPVKRTNLYREIQRIVIQDVPYLFTVQGLDLVVHRDNVHGLVYNPFTNTGSPIYFYPLYKDTGASISKHADPSSVVT